MDNSTQIRLQSRKRLLLVGIAFAGTLLAPLLSGCGPEKQDVAAPAPANTPPGGGSVDDYAKQMQQNARGNSGGGGAPGAGGPAGGGRMPSPPGPGGGR